MTQTNKWRSRLKKAALLGLGVGALALAHRHRATVRRKITDFKERSKDAYGAFQATAKTQKHDAKVQEDDELKRSKAAHDAKVQEDDKLKRRKAAHDAWRHNNYGAVQTTANNQERQEDAQKKTVVFQKKTLTDYFPAFFNDAKRQDDDAKHKRRQQDDAWRHKETINAQAQIAEQKAVQAKNAADNSQFKADNNYYEEFYKRLGQDATVYAYNDSENPYKNAYMRDKLNKLNLLHEQAYHKNKLKMLADEFADHYKVKAETVLRGWEKKYLGGRRRTRYK